MIAAIHSPIPPALRGDLIVTPQTFESLRYYIIKDPVSLDYYRLSEEDYVLATLFDGKQSLEEVLNLFLQRFPYLLLEVSREEVLQRIRHFANELSTMRFLAPGSIRANVNHQVALSKKQSKPWFDHFVHCVFFPRFSLFDPDILFGKMANSLSWIWTRSFFWISTGIIAAAVVVFMMNAWQASTDINYLFFVRNLALLWVLTILIKCIHELGHGLTCKHFGGEVHEVGVMLLVFTPYFFVNVSDSWVLPRRRERVLISAAGIYVELLIAAFATFGWSLTQPGFLHQVLYNIMIIASVSTLIFNANPLMRFDGYYILTDLMEVPNLQTKSRELIQFQLRKLLFGGATEETLEHAFLPQRRLWLFQCYAILSWMFGYLVIYKLTQLMGKHLAPFGLEGLSNWFTAIALLSWVVFPIFGFLKNIKITLQNMKSGRKAWRILFVGGLLTAVCAFLYCRPYSLEIHRSLAVVLNQPESIRSKVSGFVKDVYVHEGDKVQPGDPLAVLVNINSTPHGTSEDVNTETQGSAIGENPAKLSDVNEPMILRTQSGGTVITPDLASKAGRMLPVGELFCVVASVDRMRVIIPLSEHEVALVEKGQAVSLKLLAYPEKTFSGVIAENPMTLLGRNMPPQLSALRHGDVAPTLDHTGAELPEKRTYEAVVLLDNPHGLLRAGMSGRAVITVGKVSASQWMKKVLLDLISLDARL